LLNERDPERWHWWGEAAKRGAGSRFVKQFPAQLGVAFPMRRNVGLLNTISGLFFGQSEEPAPVFVAPVVFAIGRALNGNVDHKKGDIFRVRVWQDSVGAAADKAVAFYMAQLVACRDAVNAWSIVATRFKVVKDIRKLIAKLIWDTRGEALYSIQEQ
jgi:hypothetical protein